MAGLLQPGDFTNYSENGFRAKVVGEMAIFRQLGVSGRHHIVVQIVNGKTACKAF